MIWPIFVLVFFFFFFFSDYTYTIHYFVICFFLFLVAKTTPPKNTKISHKIWCFFEKSSGKVFLVIFKNFQPNFLWLWLKPLILHDFSKQKNKQKIFQNGKYGLVAPVLKTGFSFFVALYSFFNSSVKWWLYTHIKMSKCEPKLSLLQYFAYTYIINRLAGGFAHGVKACHAWWNALHVCASLRATNFHTHIKMWAVNYYLIQNPGLFVLNKWSSENCHSCL